MTFTTMNRSRFLGTACRLPAAIWLCLALLLHAATVRADDFDTLRLAWRDYLTGGTNLNLADATIASRVSGAASSANSSWSSLIKTNGRPYLWSDAASTTVSADITTCYNRLSAMAQGWAMVGSSLYGNTNLASDIVAALDWLYVNRYNETKAEYNNWWDWEIGVPMALNNVMVMMYPVLSGGQITNYCAAIDKFSPTVTLTGANRVWKAEAVGVRGAVGRNAAKVAAARDGLSDVAGGGASSVFAYVTASDGFYREGSFIQHGKHPYTAGYGLYLFRDVAKMLVWLDASPWAVTNSQRTNVVHWCYDSYEPLIYYGAMPEHLRGREISRNYNGYSAGHGAINAILRVAQTAPPADAARLKSMVKYWGQADKTASLPSYVDIDLVPAAEQLLSDGTVTPRTELIGHYQFPSMDRVMHLRPGFGFGLSLFSSRIYNYECINSENWHGWFTGYGMTYLWTTNDPTQFTDYYWPSVDPYHLPGTTVALTALANGANQGKNSTQSWVGGANLSNSVGMAGMALADVNGSLVGNKSWFMFDDGVVCLGAGITCGSATNVHTTVENRRLNSSGNNAFSVNGTAMLTALGWSATLSNVTWCALDGSGGYYFPGGANLLAARTARSGKWSDINAGGSTSSGTRNYLSLVVDHGVVPTNSSYAYVVLPNYTASAVSQYAASPEIVVLTNTAAVQAVRETSQGILAANFWTDGAKSVDLLTASGKCAVVIRETNGVLEVAASDPTWLNTGILLLTLSRAASSVLSADAGVTLLQLSPTVQLSISVSGARGRTFQARLATVPTILAVPDSAATGGATPLLIDVLANDIPAGLPLSLTGVSAPGNGAASVVNQRVNYVPRAGFSGTDGFSYFIGDGQHSATGLVSVAVGGAALALTPAQVLASSNQPGNVPESTVDSDPTTRWSAQGDGQWIQYDLLSTQLVDAVSIAFYAGDQRLSYLDINLSGDSTNWAQVFTGQSGGTTTNLQRFDCINRWARYVRIVGHGNSQGSGWNSYTEVRVHTATNAAPLAQPDSGSTRAGVPLDIPVLANDQDPDNGPQALFLVSLGAPAHGTATTSGGGVRYQPSPGYSGTDSFTYVVSDSGLSATGAVTVTITNLPVLPPVLAPVADQGLIAGATLSVTNQASDLGAPPQRLVFSLVAAPEGAAIDPTNGVITWRPAIAQAGTSNRFTVTVTQAGWVTTFSPVADAYVRDGSYANTNFGVDPNLVVKLGGAGLSRESYLRFAASNLSGSVAAASLLLTPTTTSLPGTHAVAVVSNDSWSEASLAWTNKPASGPALATWAPQAGVVVAVPVAAAVQGVAGSGGLLSLRLFATNSTADGFVQYGSKEGPATTAPQLEVTSANGPGLSATQSFWVRVSAPASPHLQVVGMSGHQIALEIAGSMGPDYVIEAATNLVDAAWIPRLITNSPALPFRWSDPEPSSGGQRFYRVRLGP